MKKIIVALAMASSALVAAAPASAQYGDRYRQDYRNDRYDDRGVRGGDVRQRIERINFRIERGIERGTITRREAQRLRYEVNNVSRLAQRYGHDGMSGRERADLERRLDWLQQRVQHERSDDDRRGWR
jgi:hypothetical protein